ncbi:MAG: hypothetical protein M0P16_11955 [Syntrophales bacterium]|jgi:hypothetical protein|nr:hypothetical protein [Syntrophales bacterium]MCK9391611.1 hypothetical protein [Syntrophales bacterium]
MPRWTYKTNIIDLDQVVPPEAIECDLTGDCMVNDLQGKGLAHFKGMLDKEGESEWELVQCQYHGAKLLCIWKKEVKEAFAS